MKVRLKDTIGTIHGAKGSNMKNLIITTGILGCSRTFSDKCPFVPGENQILFPFGYGIRSLINNGINIRYIRKKFYGNGKTFLKSLNIPGRTYFFVDK
jgi:hypothetical protein